MIIRLINRLLDGAPLDLSKIMQMKYLTLGHSENVDSGASSIMLPPSEQENAAFPLLSQGDHPVLGTPSWYLHPCNTASAVEVFMEDLIGDTWGEDEESKDLFLWLSTWFMIIGNAVTLVI